MTHLRSHGGVSLGAVRIGRHMLTLSSVFFIFMIVFA